MRATLPLAAVAALAASLAPSRAATAQAAVQAVASADVRRPDAPAVAPAVAAPVRLVAAYRFARRDVAGLPAEISLADSAGQLTARYRPAGAGATAAPMAVAFEGDDVVLRADTPSGPLTVRLDRQNAAPSTALAPVAGRWWLGDARGALYGRTR